MSGTQTVTLDGRLTNLAGDAGLLDASVVIDIQIMNPLGTCVLYEEHQTVNTTQTDGRFTVLVGSMTSDAKRTGSDVNNPMVSVFQNNTPIAGSCGTYTPVAGATRIMHVTVAPSTTGLIEVLSPDTILDQVPNALVAESLQGLDRDHVLAIDSTSVLNQTNVANIFSSTNYPLLTDLLSGNSSKYVTAAASGGAKIPSVAGVPVSPAAGQIWFNSSANSFQYYNGTAVQTLGVAGSGLSSLTVGSSITSNGVANTAVTSGGVLDLANSGVTAGTYSKVTVNGKGLVTYGTGLAEIDIPTLSTPGHVSGSAITSGTIGGTTSFYSSGNVTAQNVSSGVNITRQLQLFDPAPSSTHKILISAPTLASDYSLVFPATAGTAGYALTTDGSGNLSWSNVASNSLPGLASGKIWIGNSAGVATAVTPYGDVNLSIAGSATVTGLQGSPVSAAAPTTAGQILRWNGSAWTPNFVAMGDLRSTITGALSLTGCLQSQTLVFSSASDSLICSSIQIANSQITWGSTGANLVFAGPATGGAAAPAFRALTAADLPAGLASQWTTAGATINYLLGAVGIGTASPKATLDVYGTGAASAMLVPRDGNTRPTGVNGMLRYNTSSNAMETFANGAWSTLATSGAGGGASQWTTNGSNIYYGSGNVGVGTATPGAMLDVAGPTRFFTNAKLWNGVSEIAGMKTAPGNHGMIFVNDSNGTGELQLGAYVDNWITSPIGLGSGSSLYPAKSMVDIFGNASIGSYAGMTAAPANSLIVSGSIGVGTANPQATFDVYGTGAQSAMLVPRDSTSARPTGINGMLRYNTTNAQLETYSSGAWAGLATGASVSGSFLPLSGGTMTGAIVHSNGSAALPGMAFADITTGLYSTGAGNLTVATSGISRLTVSANGNVGIGSATPAYPLDVSGIIRGNGIYSSGTFQKLGPSSATGPAFSQNADSQTGMFLPGSGVVGFTSASVEAMRISSGGNVGVGTTSPQALLDIYGVGTAQSAMIVPRDSTAARPAGVNGMLRYNTTNAQLETYSSGAWAGLATGASGGGASQWTTSGANIYYGSSGNVGIGTATPGSKLDVNGAMQIEGDIHIGYGNALYSGTAYVNQSFSNDQNPAAPGYSFIYSSDSGMFEAGPAGSHSIGFSTAGTERLRVTNLGNVGLGTTSPQAILDVNGSGTSQSAMIVPRDSTAARPTGINGMLRYNTTNAQLETYSSGAWAGLATGSSGGGSSQWTTSGSNIYFAGSGVGIGTTTVLNTGVQGPALQIGSQQILQSVVGNQMMYARNAFYDGSWKYLTADYATAIRMNNDPGDGSINFHAVPAGAAGSALPNWDSTSIKMTIRNGGNIGIGTKSPAGLLHVVGPVNSSDLSVFEGSSASTSLGSDYVQLSLNNPDTTDGNYTSFFSKSGSTYMAGLQFLHKVHSGTPKSNMLFYTRNSSSATSERMRIDENGNVGVGTTAPQAILDVFGSGTAQSAMLVPRDSTAMRPVGINGMLRYNTTNAQLETYSSGAWAGLATGASGGGSSQWTTSGANIYYSSGNVGIGTTLPASKLDVYGAININGLNGMTFPSSDSTPGGSVGIGAGALSGQTSSAGYYNTAIGYQAMGSAMTTAATQNTAIGAQAMRTLTSGTANTAVGEDVLWNITTGSYNVGIGQYSAQLLTTGSNNLVIGSGSLNHLVSAQGNTAIGNVAGVNTTGGGNTMLGYNSGSSVTSGALNTVIGFGVASSSGLTTGSNNILIGTGSGVDTPSTGTSNFLNIGSAIFATGMTGTVGSPAGNVGVGTAAPQALLDVYGTGTASAMLVPRDSTTARPAGINGMLRYNTTNAQLETYSSGAWAGLITGALGGGSSQWTTSGSNIYYNSTGNVGIGTATLDSPLTISASTSGSQLPGSAAGTVLHVTGTDASSTRILVDSFGSSVGSLFTARRARGTASAPSALLSGDTVAVFGSRGFGATQYGGTSGSLSIYASENWSNTANGTSMAFYTTPNGTAASSAAMVLDQDASITMYGKAYVGHSGTAGQANPLQLIAGDYSTSSGFPTILGNWNASDAWGMGTATNVTDQVLKIGNVVGVQGGQGWSGTQNLTLQIPTLKVTSSANSTFAGNVGVGVTSPQALLDVSGSGVNSAIIVPRATIAQRPTTAVNGMIRYQIDNQTLEAYTNGSWSAVATASAGASQWTTAGSNIYYNSTGSVGIGQSSPARNLHITGTNAAAVIQATQTSSAGDTATLVFGHSGWWDIDASGQIGRRAEIGSVTTSTYGQNPALVFRTSNNSSSAPSERMRIDASGNVGVGTNNPQYPLHVVTNVAGAVAGFQSTNVNGWAAFNLFDSNGTSSASFGYGNASAPVFAGSVYAGSVSSVPFLLMTNNSERVRITASGNVGIGSSSPTATLDVNGTASVSSSLETASAYTASSTAYTIPNSSMNIRRITLTNNTTITLPSFSSAASVAKVWTLTVMVQQDGTGSRTLTFAAPSGDTIQWDQGSSTPPPQTTANTTTIYQFTKPADETNWYGSMVWKHN